MAWWTLLPAAVGFASTAINKPKREDYTTDVSSYQRYIANLYNQVGKRDVYRQAMEPGLRAVGRASQRGGRKMEYDLARMGMSDSGTAVQANLSMQEKYLQQVGDIASQAIAQEEQYRRRATGEASRMTAQIGQIKAQDQQNYQRAQSQWTRDMFTQALGFGAQAIAQGAQASQYKKEILASAQVADEFYGLGTEAPVSPQKAVDGSVQVEEPSKTSPGRIGPAEDQVKTGTYDMSPKGMEQASRTPVETPSVQPQTTEKPQTLSGTMEQVVEKYPNMSPQFYQNVMSNLIDKKAKEKNVQNTLTYVNAIRDISAGDQVDLTQMADKLPPQMIMSLAEAQMTDDPEIKARKVVSTFVDEGLDPEMFKGVGSANEAIQMVQDNTLKLYARALDDDSNLSFADIINDDTVPMEARMKTMELVAKNQDKGYSDAFIKYLGIGMDTNQIDSYYPEMTEDEQKITKDMLRIKNEKQYGNISGDSIKDVIYDYSLVLKRAGEIREAAEMVSDDIKRESMKDTADLLYNITTKELNEAEEYQNLTNTGVNISFGEYKNIKADVKTMVYEAKQRGVSLDKALKIIRDTVGFIPEAILRKWLNE